jgi:hypothetical protein
MHDLPIDLVIAVCAVKASLAIKGFHRQALSQSLVVACRSQYVIGELPERVDASLVASEAAPTPLTRSLY